jgi:hypothetical protein
MSLWPQWGYYLYIISDSLKEAHCHCHYMDVQDTIDPLVVANIVNKIVKVGGAFHQFNLDA